MGGSESGSPGPGGSPLSKVREALDRSRFREAIQMIAGMPKRELSREVADPLMDAMLEAASRLQDDSEDAVQAYNLVVGMGDSLPDPEARDSSVRKKIENALFNKGVVLGRQGRSEEAIAAYDDLIRRAKRDVGPTSERRLARALFNKASRLAELGRPGEAMSVYDQLVTQFASSTDTHITEALAKAMVNRGIALARLGRYDEAIADFDDVVILWGDSPDTYYRERAALALLNKATALVKLGRPEGAMGAYEEIIDRFGEDTRAPLRRQVSVARIMLESLRSDLS